MHRVQSTSMHLAITDGPLWAITPDLPFGGVVELFSGLRTKDIKDVEIVAAHIAQYRRGFAEAGANSLCL